MGGSSYNDDAYFEREKVTRSKGYKDSFTYDADLRREGKELVAHANMNPHGVKVRESCDSEAHPESLAIAVMWDGTGSMANVPRVFQKKLNTLMGLLIRKNWAPHPHILFGCIGDATWDKVPMQIGQFEAGIEMDEDLSRIVLEGGGGTFGQESYELALYFMAKHTKIDCFDKRKKKGYLFILGDEQPYPRVKKREVKAVFGDTIQADIPIAEILKEVQERWNVFFLIPGGTSGAGQDHIKGFWKELLGQNVFELDDPSDVCELIATIIGLAEDKVTDLDRAEKDLVAAGSTKAAAKRATDATRGYAASR